MAAVPGTSGSSSGGKGRKPPNKRGRVEIELPPDSHNSSNEESSSQEDAIDRNQAGYVTNPTRDTSHFKCSICQEYPRKEVYQCVEGHIVCHECIGWVTRCPYCRKDYSAEKIRSRAVETELDQMTYNCSFRDDGCLMKDIPRGRRTAHEIQCDHNPNKPGFQFCSLCDAREACQFRIDPNSILKEAEHSKDVIEHLTRPPHNLLFQKVKTGEILVYQFLLPASPCPPFEPLMLFEVHWGETLVGYYVLIRRVSKEDELTFSVVALNSAPEKFGPSFTGKMTTCLSISAKVDLEKRARDGDRCVANLTFTVKSTFLNEWKDFMDNPSKNHPPCSFPLPLTCFLSKLYKKQDGRFELIMNFGPLE